MTQELGMTPDALRRYDRRHGLLALLLLALLVLLPLVFGIGPTNWQRPTVTAAAAGDAATAALTAAPPAARSATPSAAPSTTPSAAPTPVAAVAASASDAGAPQAAASAPPAPALVPTAAPAVVADAASVAASTPAPAAAAAPAAADAPPRRLLFADASHRLPAGADKLLSAVAATAKADPSVRVVLSGYHSKGVKSLAFNRELARRRAAEVARRLQALGVPADRIEQVEPTQTLGGANAREARRVEIALRR